MLNNSFSYKISDILKKVQLFTVRKLRIKNQFITSREINYIALIVKRTYFIKNNWKYLIILTSNFGCIPITVFGILDFKLFDTIF